MYNVHLVNGIKHTVFKCSYSDNHNTVGLYRVVQ